MNGFNPAKCTTSRPTSTLFRTSGSTGLSITALRACLFKPCPCNTARRKLQDLGIKMIYDVNSPLFRSFLSQKGGASDKSPFCTLLPLKSSWRLYSKLAPLGAVCPHPTLSSGKAEDKLQCRDQSFVGFKLMFLVLFEESAVNSYEVGSFYLGQCFNLKKLEEQKPKEHKPKASENKPEWRAWKWFRIRIRPQHLVEPIIMGHDEVDLDGTWGGEGRGGEGAGRGWDGLSWGATRSTG
ncbi:hypothetical protein ACLOJK_013010 [Asimina triloba]